MSHGHVEREQSLVKYIKLWRVSIKFSHVKMIKGNDLYMQEVKRLSHEAQIVIRKPKLEEGADIWRLVKSTGILDLNSAYNYLMLCKFFADTCAVAESDGQIVGFVTAFRPPTETDSLFVWQIGVDATQRGKGLATRLLHNLLERESVAGIRYITATISPSNRPSRALFEKLSRQLEAPLQVVDDEGIPEHVFPEKGHESEPLVRLGPLN